MMRRLVTQLLTWMREMDIGGLPLRELPKRQWHSQVYAHPSDTSIRDIYIEPEFPLVTGVTVSSANSFECVNSRHVSLAGLVS